jgi:hypothetical protein
MKALTRHIISSRCFLNVHIPWHSRHDNGAANYDIEPVAGWTLVDNRSCLLLGGVTCDGLEGEIIPTYLDETSLMILAHEIHLFIV